MTRCSATLEKFTPSDGGRQRMQAIAADRFTLVPLVEAHAAALYPVLADPALYRYTDGQAPESLAELATVFRRRESRRSPDGTEHWLNWGLQLPSGDWAGHLQATVFEPGAAWVAYIVAVPFWGRGLGRDATRAMIDHLGTDYACTRFLACVERDNAASIGLLRSLSFSLAAADERQAHGLGDSEALYVRRQPPG